MKSSKNTQNFWIKVNREIFSPWKFRSWKYFQVKSGHQNEIYYKLNLRLESGTALNI